MDFNAQYDVAVVGGGIAGVAAAIQAARSGRKTVLIEKTILLGGLATSGLIYVYLPLCDGNGHQTTFGLCEELIRNSLIYGPGDIPENWRNEKNAPEVKRFICRFSPASFMLSMEELLLDSGVDLWLDTLVCAVETKEAKMTSVIVENESGRGRIEARCFIDASGSSILARRAGVPCLEENNSLSLWAMMYALGKESSLGQNLSFEIHTGAALSEPRNIWLRKDLSEKLFPEARTDKELLEALTYRGLSGKKVSRFVQDTHRILRESLKIEYASGRSDRTRYFPLKLPLMPQFRKTYCIEGDYVLAENQNNLHFEDSIGMLPDWRKSGPVWEIPFRSLYSRRMGGLLAAGRCTAASGDAWEITRVIPSAAMTGQVAGLAASMSIEQGKEPWELEVADLQKRLRKLGFKLHLGEIGL